MSTMPLTQSGDTSGTPAALTLTVRTTDAKEHRFVQRDLLTAYHLLESEDLTRTFSDPLLQIGGPTGMTVFPTVNIVRLELEAAVTMEAQWPAGMMLVREVTGEEAARTRDAMRLEAEMGIAPRRPGTAIAELDLFGGERFTVEIRADIASGAENLGPRTALDPPFFQNRLFGASGTPIVSATGSLIILNPVHIVSAVIHAPADVPSATLLEMTAVE